jgi:IclR family pca regulon transcriptional regulator
MGMNPDVAKGRSAVTTKDNDDPDFIKSLAKGLAVIEAFDAGAPNMTLSRIAAKVGLSPGSARRVLVTLTRLGYVVYNDDDRRYSLAARTLQLGYTYLASQPALDLLKPRLAELSDQLNESCSIMLRDGREVVCVARATARRLQRDYMSVGTRIPAHASSTGKLLLGSMSDAEFNALYDGVTRLPEVTPFTVCDITALRKQCRDGYEKGWLFVDQETALGMSSVAVLLEVNDKVSYGLSTSATLMQDGPTFVERYLPELLKAADAMRNALRARG